MKKFNHLPLKQRKVLLIIFCLLFALLLLVSIRYQPLKMRTGLIRQPRIMNDTSKLK